DSDISSPLWEITLDGRIKRQLTFLPTSGVHSISNEAIAMRVTPNPFETSTNVVFSLDSPAEANIQVFDVLGREVGLEGPDYAHVFDPGEHTIPVDLGKALAGTYYVRVALSNNEVRTLKL